MPTYTPYLLAALLAAGMLALATEDYQEDWTDTGVGCIDCLDPEIQDEAQTTTSQQREN
jgi:hypothetical protein